MTPSTRRSSRLRGSSSQPMSASPAPQATLSAVAEREETVNNFDQPSKSGIAAQTTPKASAKHQEWSKTARTPTTRGDIVPAKEEMHPALYHSSKKMQQANRITAPPTPTVHAANSSPMRPSPTNRMSTIPTASTFDFRHTSVELNSEAQKIMDEVRAQASRIKEELRAQEQARDHENPTTKTTAQGRRIAQPKGKAGRFSDVHMADFRKMDSIANHASAFRADPGRFPPSQKSLKRTKSNAELDKPESSPARAMPGKSLTPRPAPPAPPIRSAKRVKQTDGSAAVPRLPIRRQDSSDTSNNASPSKANVPTPRFRPSLMTPTKASLARSASARSVKTDAKILALARSDSTKSVVTPTKGPSYIPRPGAAAVAQTENSHKFRNAMASRLSNVKSILRRPQLRYSDDPTKLAAGTHLATPKTSGKDKVLPQLPEEPGTPSHRAEKHVNFTASTSAPTEAEQTMDEAPTPTPAKKSVFSSNFGQVNAVQYPTLAFAEQLPPSPSPASKFAKAQPRAFAIAGPGDFTFRSDKPISFSSSSRVTAPSATIRHVVESEDLCKPLATASNLSSLPTIAHGLSNKKRKRVTGDSSESNGNFAGFAEEAADKENSGNFDDDHSFDPQSPTKRPRMMSMSAQKAPPAKGLFSKTAMSSPLKPVSSPSKRSAFQKGKAKGALTMSRLNALARPKERK